MIGGTSLPHCNNNNNILYLDADGSKEKAIVGLSWFPIRSKTGCEFWVRTARRTSCSAFQLIDSCRHYPIKSTWRPEVASIWILSRCLNLFASPQWEQEKQGSPVWITVLARFGLVFETGIWKINFCFQTPPLAGGMMSICWFFSSTRERLGRQVLRPAARFKLTIFMNIIVSVSPRDEFWIPSRNDLEMDWVYFFLWLSIWDYLAF